MKKIYLSVLLLFFTVCFSAAQTSEEYNVKDMAAYATCVNKLAVENGFSTFLWDCSTHMDRKNLKIKYPEYIDAIINSYPKSSKKGNGKNPKVFEEESASDAVKNFRAGWNLGNTLDATSYKAETPDEPGWIIKYGKKDADGNLTPATWEKAWGQPETNQEIADFIIDAGFNAIRIPVTWAEHLDEDNNVDAAWMKRVQETVDYFYNRGVYVIINAHHDGGGDGWIKASDKYYEMYNGRFKKLWTQIAQTFVDYDERLLFESMNEVLDENKKWDHTTQEALNCVNKWNQLFVDSVRATGGNNSKRNLVLMTYCGGGNNELFSNFVIPKDKAKNHLILEVHNYNPHAFTWTDVTWTTMTAKWNPSVHGDQLKKEFEVYKKYSDQLKLPLIIGEYNADPKKYADYDQNTKTKIYVPAELTVTSKIKKENTEINFEWQKLFEERKKFFSTQDFKEMEKSLGTNYYILEKFGGDESLEYSFRLIDLDNKTAYLLEYGKFQKQKLNSSYKKTAEDLKEFHNKYINGTATKNSKSIALASRGYPVLVATAVKKGKMSCFIGEGDLYHLQKKNEEVATLYKNNCLIPN